MPNPNHAAPPDISVVIPCFNEEENILPLWQALHEILLTLSRPYEVLFVDDGSTDHTQEILRRLKAQNPELRIISLKKNTGLSAALSAGFRSVRGEIVVTLDADLQNDPADIPKLLANLPQYDMAFGWRQKRQDNLIRIVSTKIANTVRNYLTGENIPDIGCTLKAFKRSCIQTIKMYNGMHRFLPTLFKMEGFKTIQVPVQHHPRRHGKAKFGVWNRMGTALLDCLAVRWMLRRSIRLDMEEIE